MHATFRALLLLAVLDVASAGSVVSALRPRAADVLQRSSLPAGAERTIEPGDVGAFRLQLQRLSAEAPDAPGALRSLLGFLRLHASRGRPSICLWDPAVRDFLAGSPSSVACLLAAGFCTERRDRHGAPFLEAQRLPRASVSAMEAACEDALATAEAVAGPPKSSRRSARPVSAPRLRADRRPSEGEEGDGRSAGEGSVPKPEEEEEEEEPADEPDTEGGLVEQLQGMISGLISEIERQVQREPRSRGVPAPGNTTEAPVHFRIYASKPPFAGLPPPMGMPFLPGGGGDDEDGEIPTLERRLRAARLPAEAEEVVSRELRRLRRMSPMHSEYSTLVDYLEWMADLPWGPPVQGAQPPVPLAKARAQLDADHFAMEKVKQRVLEFLAVCHLRGDTKGSILCMLGPPGIGKTSLGKSIAAALNRPFHRVSVGGIHSEAEVRGHRRTYVGALPGLILQAIKKCGASNCVIMLDEIDKLGRHSYNGDPSSALLEVLDPEQNAAFRDHFLAVPFNLSQVLFIATANEMEPIPRPLRDRMEVLELTGYTVDDKVQIALRHLLPKQVSLHGLPAGHLQLGERELDHLISGYTREAGVRELERKIGALCRALAANVSAAAEGGAAAGEGESPDRPGADTGGGAKATAGDGAARGTERRVAEAGPAPVRLGVADIEAVLGPPRFDGPRDVAKRVTKPGIALGLAATAYGGETLYVEVEMVKGKGAVQLTGNIKEVMQESAKAALTWIRAHVSELGLTDAKAESLLNTTDLHIHFPEGATPKDGPSAGVTITTAICSLLTGRLVRHDVAMTGEVTLRGLVLPVGGIKEKVVAAHRAGVRTVILPEANEKDLRELPQKVVDSMRFILATDVRQVIDAALVPLHDETGDTAGGQAGGGGAPATDGRQGEPAAAPLQPARVLPAAAAL